MPNVVPKTAMRESLLSGYSLDNGGLGEVSNSGLLILAGKEPATQAGPTTKWLTSLVLIATGYFLAGRMGQLLAVPPSYATAIWPASGIALAGVLLAGYRVWPGLFLGALLVNGWTPLSNADGIQAAAGSLLVPGSISAGATFQALIGAFLVRRFVGFPNPLIQDRLILAFLALGGPLACLVGASWGVASLAAVGAIEGASQLALNWWTWWVGDKTTLNNADVLKPTKNMPVERDDRFPVIYLEPANTKAVDLGFDFVLESQGRDLLRRCCDSGRQVASYPTGTRISNRDHSLVFIFAPIYSTDDPPASVVQRRQSLGGYVLGIYQIDELIRSSLPRTNAEEFSLSIVDISDKTKQFPIYSQSRDASPHKASEVAPLLRQNIGVSATIRFADRTWLCEFLPTSAFYAGQAHRHTWMILASGLAMTALLGAFLLILSGRTARIKASESRYLDLYENAPDMFLSLDVATQRVIECNRTFLETAGFRKHQVVDRHMYELVFLVDDDESLRDARTWLLESVDLKVETFASAADFLEVFDPKRHGCLVVDIRMPGMSGLALQKQLREAKIEIPVLVVTGHGDVPMCVQAFQNGAFTFLEKPVNHQKFLEEIYRAIEHDSQQRRQRSSDVANLIEALSPREREVMELLVAGNSMKHIALQFGISVQTCSKHRARVLEKMAVNNDVELVRLLLAPDSN